MANREENLKKINVELEMLSDEELEKIAGGIFGKTAEKKNLIGNNLVSETFEEELKQLLG